VLAARVLLASPVLLEAQELQVLRESLVAQAFPDLPELQEVLVLRGLPESLGLRVLARR